MQNAWVFDENWLILGPCLITTLPWCHRDHLICSGLTTLKNKWASCFPSVSLLNNDGLVTDSSYQTHPTLTVIINHKQVWRQVMQDGRCSSGFIQHQLSHPLMTCQLGSLTTDYPVHQNPNTDISNCHMYLEIHVVCGPAAAVSGVRVPSSTSPSSLYAGLDTHSQSPPCWGYLGGAYRKSTCH